MKSVKEKVVDVIHLGASYDSQRRCVDTQGKQQKKWVYDLFYLDLRYFATKQRANFINSSSHCTGQ